MPNNPFYADLARRKFSKFVSYTKSDYEVNWHHNHLMGKLDAFSKGEIKNMMVFMPPQHGKSELVSRRLPANIMGAYPDKKMILASYSADMSATFNRDVQNIMFGDEYHEIYPNTWIGSDPKAPKANGKFSATTHLIEVLGHRGFLKTVGVGGSLTGTPADIGFIDDPVKDHAEAHSEVFREKVWNWYLTVFRTRLHDNSQQLLTMTRWHYDDLDGRILEDSKETGEHWEIVVFPAIKEDNNNQDDPREIGEALWESRHGIKKLRRYEKTSKRIFTPVYQQKPSPDEGDVWEQWFIIVKDSVFPSPPQMTGYGTDWDLAYTAEDKNSASAYITSGKIEGNVYIDNLGYVNHEFPNLVKFMAVMPSPHYIEGKASGKSATQTLLSMGITAIEVPVTGGDKVARANMVTPHAEAGRVYIRESVADKLYHDSKQGILKFPNGLHDDVADALTQSLQRHFKKREIWGA